MRKILLIFVLYILGVSNAFSLIEVDITRGNLDPLPIAVSPLHVDLKSEEIDNIKVKILGDEISKIIEKNFKSTGLFNPLKKDAFVQKPDMAHLKQDSKIGDLKAQALVTGKILVNDGKQVNLDYGI